MPGTWPRPSLATSRSSRPSICPSIDPQSTPSFTSSRPLPPIRSTRSSPSSIFSPAISSKQQPEKTPYRGYVNALSEAIGHADRIDPLRRYCTGLLLPGERKSIEPMAARLDPQHVQATHQSLHHFVAKAPWDDAAVLTAVREQVLPALT